MAVSVNKCITCHKRLQRGKCLVIQYLWLLARVFASRVTTSVDGGCSCGGQAPVMGAPSDSIEIGLLVRRKKINKITNTVWY